jgi:hypothetical protein
LLVAQLHLLRHLHADSLAALVHAEPSSSPPLYVSQPICDTSGGMISAAKSAASDGCPLLVSDITGSMVSEAEIQGKNQQQSCTQIQD